MSDLITLPLIGWAAVVAAIYIACWVASIPKNRKRP